MECFAKKRIFLKLLPQDDNISESLWSTKVDHNDQVPHERQVPLLENRYDVLIIGGGVVGCAIARELSRYSLRTAVLEKDMDVGLGTSSRNSGVLHAGFNYRPGTLRARLDVEGNALMTPLCRQLKVKIKKIGKLTVAQDVEEIEGLHRLLEQGRANGVPGLKLLEPETMQKIQPGVEGIMALHSPTSGIVCPYGLTVALADNAYRNGVHFYLGAEVNAIRRTEATFRLTLRCGGTFSSPIVINAAGLFADRIAAMAGIDEYRIYPCRGEYYILDKKLDGSLSTLIYPAPRKDAPGLGIHLTPTVDGNILIGPSAEYIDAHEDYACTADVMRALQKEGRGLLSRISTSDFIRNFSGVRPKQTPPEVGGNRDFVIENRKDVPGFINLVGIESPGLTSSPAIARMVTEMVGQHLSLKANPDFEPERPGRAEHFHELPAEDKAALVAENPDYGEIICRCEQITKQEILDAINNPIGARTLVGIKYRARAMMGRCQGGFCLPRITRILAEEFGMTPEEFMLRGKDSPTFVGRVREGSEV